MHLAAYVGGRDTARGIGSEGCIPRMVWKVSDCGPTTPVWGHADPPHRHQTPKNPVPLQEIPYPRLQVLLKGFPPRKINPSKVLPDYFSSDFSSRAVPAEEAFEAT